MCIHSCLAFYRLTYSRAAKQKEVFYNISSILSKFCATLAEWKY